jgi:hypothetical protein
LALQSTVSPFSIGIADATEVKIDEFLVARNIDKILALLRGPHPDVQRAVLHILEVVPGHRES